MGKKTAEGKRDKCVTGRYMKRIMMRSAVLRRLNRCFANRKSRAVVGLATLFATEFIYDEQEV